MAETKTIKSEIIKCGCSQENHLVCVGGVWRRDAKKHGTDAVFTGKCFNCPAEIKGPKGWKMPPAKGKVDGGTDVEKEVMKGLVAQMERMEKAMGEMEGKVNGLTEEKDQLAEENRQLRKAADEGGESRVDLGAMSAVELREYAGQQGVELPPGNVSKVDMIAAIEVAGNGEDRRDAANSRDK